MVLFVSILLRIVVLNPVRGGMYLLGLFGFPEGLKVNTLWHDMNKSATSWTRPDGVLVFSGVLSNSADFPVVPAPCTSCRLSPEPDRGQH